MEMNIQKYMSFVKTVEYGSFTKASEILNYSQSGISRMIGDLEKEWNMCLLERDHSGVKPTSDGLRLLPFAKKLCDDFDRLQMEADNLNDLSSGIIRIGTFSSVATYWLPNIIMEFKKDYPNLRVVGHRNGYFSAEEEEAIQEDIREKNPDFVFVGITSPKKEYLIQKFMDNGVNSVFMGVGGSFDVLSGHIKRAPMWMQKANLEWLFRVANEPKRLFKRYFVGNATFIKRVVHEKRKAKK